MHTRSRRISRPSQIVQTRARYARNFVGTRSRVCLNGYSSDLRYDTRRRAQCGKCHITYGSQHSSNGRSDGGERVRLVLKTSFHKSVRLPRPPGPHRETECYGIRCYGLTAMLYVTFTHDSQPQSWLLRRAGARSHDFVVESGLRTRHVPRPGTLTSIPGPGNAELSLFWQLGQLRLPHCRSPPRSNSRAEPRSV